MRPVLRSVPRLSPRTLPPPHHLPSCHPHRTLTSLRRASLPHHASYPPDALDAPLRPQHTSRPSDRVLPLTAREETLLRAKTVFGDRRSAAEERRAKMEGESRMIAGVRVPPRPEEPEDCCMSGCVNCVWEVHREDLEEWIGRKAEARRRGGMMLEDDDGGGKVRCVGGVDDGGGGGGGREGNWGGGDGVEERVKAGKGGEGDGEGEGDPLEGIPVGIREFMKTERKLKQRHREAGEVWEKALDKDLRASVWGSGT